ncbi:MAG: glycosyltransferase [Bacilli bacterium]
MKNIQMILTNGFDPDIRVYKEAKYLVKLGHAVTIHCWDRDGTYIDRIDECFEGINIKRYPIISEYGGGAKQFFPFIKFGSQVKKQLQRESTDILYCHDFDGALVGYFSNINCKYIIDMHELFGGYIYSKIPIISKVLFKRILNKAKAVVYVNEVQLLKMNDKIKNKSFYIPNYPIKDIYYPIKKSFRKGYDICYVGYVRDELSLMTLARINTIDHIGDIRVHFHGRGELFNNLKKLEDNFSVFVEGSYNGITEVGDIYRKTDILYCVYDPKIKNHKVSFPVKLFEAIITETPIIVCKDTNAGDFVEKMKIGESVTCGDATELSSAIKKIISNYEVYIKNLKKISNDYCWEAIQEKLSEIIK